MEEELTENELEERLYSMIHYVDQTQPETQPNNQNALNICEIAPRSTVRRYWRTSEHTTPTSFNKPYQKTNNPYQKINTHSQKINTPSQKVTTPCQKVTQAPQLLKPNEEKSISNETKPKEEKCSSQTEPLPEHLSLFQCPVPQNLKRTIEIIETEEENVVDLESSDEDEVVEVALPPKPTITIESSDDEITIQDTPTKTKPTQDKSNGGEREVSASPVPSIVSSVSDDFIRGDCIALNISSRRPDNPSFDFSLHGPDLLGSTPSKKKKKKLNKTGTSTPVDQAEFFDECFATPKSKAKNKKQKNKQYAVTEKSVPSVDIYDSDSNQSTIELNRKNDSFSVSEKRNHPCADVYETDSNPSETPRAVEKPIPSKYIDVDNSDNSISDNPPPAPLAITHDESAEVSETIDLTDNSGSTVNNDIQENFIMANVTGFTEPDLYEEPIGAMQQPSKFGSTKVPAILYENLDFDNLKGKEKVCKSRRYSLTTLRAEMEKFYNESWGGEDFNHREIQKNMSRDKSLWAIDPKDRMTSLNRKKFNVICNYCNRPGHRDDTCRQKPPICYMCGDTGHFEPRCPSKICVNCGSPNYMYSTMCRNCSTWSRVTCAECGQHGHPASHCPDIWRRYHNTIDITAHLEENRNTKKHYQLFCSGCTRRGHLVHACRVSLPFSGLPINAPYVHMYRPIYMPENPCPSQRNRQSFNCYQQDSTITSATTPAKNDRFKRQSKSPAVHETHSNKKRNLSMSDLPEKPSNPVLPVQPEPQRKLSQSKESAGTSGTTEDVPKQNTENQEKAPDFIPICSSNHDEKGQVIQDNEVSDTSDVVNSARIYITREIIDKLKTKEGQDWLKDTTTKFDVSVETSDINSFLCIKGIVANQEAFQTVLREWAKDQSSPAPVKTANVIPTQQPNESKALWSHNFPKNRNNVLRKLSKALESLKEDLGEPNALYKELKYLQHRHGQLLNQKVVKPQQLDNNRDHINEMLKKLNMILVGQAGLAGGSLHLQQLLALQEKVINLRQKNIPVDLREAIGEHFHCIFTSLPRNDYGDLLNTYNSKSIQKKKKKLKNKNPKSKKFNAIPGPHHQMVRNPFNEMKNGDGEKKIDMSDSKSHMLRKPLVEKTINKLSLYRKRLIKARPNDMVLKKTRDKLVKLIYIHIGSLTKNAMTSSRNLRKIKKVQEQAQLFLNNV